MTPQFFQACKDLAHDLRCSSVYDLLGVMFYESGCQTSIKNRYTQAVGLIQFMPNTLRLLGYTDGVDAFAALTHAQQMVYVRKYLERYAPLPTMAHVYCAVFLPAFLPHAHEQDFILASKDGERSLIYRQNANFDHDRDGRIQVSELSAAVQRNCAGPRWLEIVRGVGGAPQQDPGAPVGSILWLQRGLNKLNLGPLTEDGVWGPKTETAVRIFQAKYNLKMDGIAGKMTKAKLLDILA